VVPCTGLFRKRKFSAGNRRVIQKLNQDSIRIFEIKRAGAVAVSFRRLGEGNTEFPDASRVCIDVFRAADDEPNVMYVLNVSGSLTLRQLMDGKIIGAGSQVNILSIGLPLHVHSEHVAIELHGPADVANVQCNMAETERLH